MTDRRVIITGASRGIGAATAEEFRRAGWRVVATARAPEDVARLESLGFESARLDVADERSVAAAVEAALADGPVDALVNNAGYMELGPVESVTREEWRRQFETNVFGAFDVARRLVPHMRERGGGRIVQMSSVVGRFSPVFAGVYAASKHALEAASDAMRVELAPAGIGVTLVEPGPVSTEFTNAQVAAFDARAAHAYGGQRARAQPFVRFLASGISAQRVARVVLRETTRRRPRARVRVGFVAKLGLPLNHVTPSFARDFTQAMLLGFRRR